MALFKDLIVFSFFKIWKFRSIILKMQYLLVNQSFSYIIFTYPTPKRTFWHTFLCLMLFSFTRGWISRSVTYGTLLQVHLVTKITIKFIFSKIMMAYFGFEPFMCWDIRLKHENTKSLNFSFQNFFF